MSKVNNPDVATSIREAAFLNELEIPQELSSQIVPVLEVNPKLQRRSNVVREATVSNAASGTVYTIPNGYTFYLTSCCFSIIKDATSTSIASKLNATVGGRASDIIQIVGFTLTPQDQAVTLSLISPIPIDGGTTISVIHGTAVANISARVSVHGYLVPNR